MYRRGGMGARGARRASTVYAWAPYELGSKLKLWMDGTFGVATTSGKVTSWTSRVGAHAFTQSTDSARPLLRVVNGKTAIDFDGTNDVLSGPTKGTIGIALATAQEIVAVYSADAVAAFANIDAPGLIGDAVSVWGLTVGSAAAYYSDYNTAVALKTATSGTAPSVDTVYRVRGTHDGVDNMTCKNGSGAVGTTASAGAPITGAEAHAVQMGASPSTVRCFNGVICELLGFNAALTAAERTQLDSYLAAKWGAQT